MKYLKLHSLYVGLITFVVFAANSQLNAQSIRINKEVKFNNHLFIKGLNIDFNDLEKSNDYIYRESFEVAEQLKVENINVLNIETQPVTTDVSSAILLNSVPESLIPEVYISLFRKKPYAVISFVPFIRLRDGTIERIVSYEIEVSGQLVVKNFQKGNKFSSTSVFNQGDWYKVRVSSDKVYKLSYQFLKEMGVNVGSLNPNQLNVYGHPGGMLPLDIDVDAPGDPQKLAIEFVGNQDNSFTDGEYFLFYGEGPDSWSYSENLEMWTHLKNYYSDYAYFFINADDVGPKRTNTLEVLPDSPDKIITEYDNFKFHEVNTENLIKSGRIFFGEKYENKLEYEFSFSYPDIVSNSEVKIRTAVAARNHGGSTSSFTVTPSGGDPHSFNIQAVSGDYTFAKYKVDNFSYVPSSSFTTLNVKIKYNQQFPVNIGWLDYLETNVRSKLKYRNGQLSFRDQLDIGEGIIAEYRIENAPNNLKIWDVSSYDNVVAIPGSIESGNFIFRRPHESSEKYISFRNGDAGSPEAVGSISNQNIHGVSQVDMVIITHPDFISAAQNIAAFHDEEGLTTFITTQRLIFNEFSSGKKDPTAIKHFLKSIYDGAPSPDDIQLRYLLLLGDASYNQGPGSEHSYILTYESENSWSLIVSYVTDDYFGMLDDSGNDLSKNIMDIGVGRFPVTNLQQANDIIAKMRVYKEKHTDTGNESVADFNQSTYGNWRNHLTFIADDQDNNTHMRDAEILANKVTDEHPNFNVGKIYLDAFQQVITTGGERYPDVNKRINDQVQRGTLLTTYVGHGGEVGWAHERILDIPTILSWTNINNLTVFFTATCEFSRFDDHNRISAGEYCILNQNGGSVALFSTTRLVTSGQNFKLAKQFFNFVFNDIKNPDYRLGDIIMLTKRASSGGSDNHLNFSLLGDPALRLAYPIKDVNTVSINNIPAVDVQIVVDTLNALSKVKFVGNIDLGGQDPTGYTGTLYPTIYGKEKSLSTLGNKGETPFNYVIRNTVIFSGKSSIKDGQFEFEFIVPKDIPFQYGVGKVSYYMVKNNSFDDGAGYAYNFNVGGANLDAPEDTKGPNIEIFLNDENFVSGSIVNENPILLAKINDEFGVNTAGTGIGHDITAVIDGDNKNTIVLNDFYESDEDTYQSGKLKYQLQSLKEGKHTIELKAWDVYNNSSTSLIDFEVKQKSDLSIDHLLNYPNPFTTYTEFWFEHNQALSTLQVQIQIYTVSGRLVKSIHKTIQTDGFRSDPIAWDGRDDFGDRLARGVYIYKLRVQTSDGNSVEKFEKLVILN
jgi:hypothetical protein